MEALVSHLLNQFGVRITAASYGVNCIHNFAFGNRKTRLLHLNNEAHDSFIFIIRKKSRPADIWLNNELIIKGICIFKPLDDPSDR
ncbi:hypothetical protein FOXG_07079 [Fusarium oxysporum f. sp. lycopersici 4287]|nr:hypothetical protein FOXG_07079 [Fusarium oxysporum f. sp. lycopersici 4287]KNB06326.1 hypothetical protein FOXG_07079 [Fusarium oxysporum f. sp. lycopersici 4287]